MAHQRYNLDPTIAFSTETVCDDKLRRVQLEETAISLLPAYPSTHRMPFVILSAHQLREYSNESMQVRMHPLLDLQLHNCGKQRSSRDYPP
jgi:hypothetical protein